MTENILCGIPEVYPKIKNLIKEEFLLSIYDFGVPFFNFRLQDVFEKDKVVYYIQFSSAIYPSQDDVKNYPWEIYY